MFENCIIFTPITVIEHAVSLKFAKCQKKMPIANNVQLMMGRIPNWNDLADNEKLILLFNEHSRSLSKIYSCVGKVLCINNLRYML